MKILIAEDDRTSRWALQAILTKAGYKVLAATNGEEAWQVMQGEDPPPIVLIDWLMPEMTGLEFCRKVRASAALRSTYIIFLTNKRQKEDVKTGMEAGADDYISKPFNRKDLLARLQAAEEKIKSQSSVA